MIPSIDELKNAIKDAMRNAVKDLFEINEDFYYLVLATTGEARHPYLCACSYEGLEQTVKKYVDDYGYDYTPQLKADLKWSSADSPYAYFRWDEYFKGKDVETLFYKRPHIDDLTMDEWLEEYELRISAMVAALKELDEEDVFQRKGIRKHMLINVAPNHLNIDETAFLLNNPEALKQALADNALEKDG
ncbi:MAG: DUF4303 domain-containing protein [Defluviitaleaceae bacterium]|nr:DUF4303 domain-containing protein [Defluviitaleaceae bacterium]